VLDDAIDVILGGALDHRDGEFEASVSVILGGALDHVGGAFD